MAIWANMLLGALGFQIQLGDDEGFGGWGLEEGLKMYVIESKETAIGCLVLSLFFLGTWPAIIASLERRGRLPQHSLLDYAVANLLAALITVLTVGQIGESRPGMPNFFTQLCQENWASVLFALVGGVVLSIGNLSIQYAWALVGLSIAEVMSNSISVVIGTTINYFLDGRTNKAEILFAGVGCFLIAVILGSAVHKSNAADNLRKLTTLLTKLEGAGDKDILACKVKFLNISPTDIEKANETNHKPELELELEPEPEPEPEPKFGTADFLVELEQKRSIKVFEKGSWVGLAVTSFAGICFALFSPLLNLATNDQFHLLKKGVPHLVVYTAFFYFSVSFTMVAVILNVRFLYHPILGLPKSSFTAYIRDWDGRAWAILAGFMCGFGNGLRFMGGQVAGYATADSVQALPLVSTIWGILFFGEYRRSSPRTYVLLTSMLLMFIIAVGFFFASSQHRKL